MKHSGDRPWLSILILIAVGLLVPIPSVWAQQEPVRLGVAFPLSSLYGQQTNSGVQLALKEVNDRGGILGRPVRVIILDNQDKPEEAVAVLERLITRDKVQAVAASFSSLTGLAEQKVTERYKMLHIAIAAKGDRLPYEGHPLVFYLNTTISQDSKTYNEFLAKRLRPKRVAVMLENTDYGQSCLASLKRDWTGAGSPEIVTVETYEKLEQDFTPILTKVKSLNPDVIYFANGTVEVNANIALQIDQLGIKATKVLAPGQINDDFVRVAGKSAEGVVSGDIYIYTLDSPENMAFVSAFEAVNKSKPQKVTLFAYEAIKVLAEAMTKAGTADDVERIAGVLRTSTFASPRGKLRFHLEGKSYQVDGDYKVLTVKGGKIVSYK
jgi:branched-chain amino acid transport system substrate-binding protein